MGAVTYLSTLSRRTRILGAIVLAAVAAVVALALTFGSPSAASTTPRYHPGGCGWNGHVNTTTGVCEGTTSPGVFR